MSSTICAGCQEPQRESALFCEKCGEPLFEGKEAGVYRIVERIGSGGMGSVYKAEHTKLGTHFAIKILHKQFANHKPLVERFVTEAKATSRLRHEHIIFITDFGELDKFGPYIAMEYLAGLPLKDSLTPGVPFPVERTIEIAIQLSDTMAYAHGEGIVHRDLKPDNIFLLDRKHDHRDYIKVLDFGIAKILESEDTSLTKTGAVIGTPVYMAPEQALSKPIDHRTDIYSFGVILFEILTGHLPFHGTSAFELIEQRIFKPAPKISEYVYEWKDSPLETLVDLCLKREPKDRIQTMATLKQKLEQFRNLKIDPKPQAVVPPRKSASIEETGMWADDEHPRQQAKSEANDPESKEAATPAGLATPVTPDEAPPTSRRSAPSKSVGPLPTGVDISYEEAPRNARTPSYSTPAPSGKLDPVTRTALLFLTIFILGGGAYAAISWIESRKHQTSHPAQLNPGPTSPTKISPPPIEPRKQSAPAPAPVAPNPNPVPDTKVESGGDPPTPPPAKRASRRRRIRRIRRTPRPTPYVPRITPTPRVLTPPTPPRPTTPQLGFNGCPLNTPETSYVRLRIKHSRVKVRISSTQKIPRAGQLIRATKGGWCIPITGARVFVGVFGDHIELADCFFPLSRESSPILRLRLKSNEDVGPGAYCTR